MKIYRNVGWTDPYTPCGANDNSEPYCLECDEELNEDWKYCPYCGIELIFHDYKEVEDENI